MRRFWHISTFSTTAPVPNDYYLRLQLQAVIKQEKPNFKAAHKYEL